MSDTCRLFPLLGDPWPSCLLPSQVLEAGGLSSCPTCHTAATTDTVILRMYFIPVSSYFPLPVPLLLSCHFLKMYLRNEHK